MRKLTGLLLTLVVSTPALAWVPKLDDSTAKVVLDSAYNRAANPTPTLLTVDLNVKDGQFASGAGAVTAFEGGSQCISDWTANPSDYSQGSRPVSVTLTGQADALFLKAQQARDAFKNLSVKDALTPDKNALPDGDLKVYVQMAGLQSDKQRDAYDVALRTASAGGGQASDAAATDGASASGDQGAKIVRPYKRAYTNDWKQGKDGLWGGTMVYYFNATKNGVQPNSKVDILMRTEADTDCAYSVTADLSKFN